jgi:hypothetical protein
VFERVVSRGKTILSFNSNKVSLEQVFLRLTEAETYEDARKLLGFEEVVTEAEVEEEPIKEETNDDSNI